MRQIGEKGIEKVYYLPIEYQKPYSSDIATRRVIKRLSVEFNAVTSKWSKSK
jgi:hypothetical protein